MLLQPSTPWSSCSLTPGLGSEYPKPLTLLFLWGRIWSEHSEAEEAGNRASDRRSIISTGRVRLTVFVGCAWVLAVALRNTIYVWKLSSWKEKNTVENVNGCFLIQSAKSFFRQWQSFYLSFELGTDATGCTMQWKAEKNLPHNAFALCYVYSPPHCLMEEHWGFQRMYFWSLWKKKEFHVQLLLRFLAS